MLEWCADGHLQKRSGRGQRLRFIWSALIRPRRTGGANAKAFTAPFLRRGWSADATRVIDGPRVGVRDCAGSEPTAEALLDLILEAFGCASVAEEQEFQACPLAVLAQVRWSRERFPQSREPYGDNLALVEERVDPRRKEWISPREPLATNAQ